MIPVFIISLSDCQERRKKISRQLCCIGIDFEFIDAVDGRNGLDALYEMHIDRQATTLDGRPLSDAEFACALSHISVYKRIVTDYIDHAIVLEDDAFPTAPLLEFLSGKHYRDADLTLLWYRRTFVRRQRRKKLFKNYVSYLCAPKIPQRTAMAYVISYYGAKHLLKNALPIRSEADWPQCAQMLLDRERWRVIAPLVDRSEEHPSIIEIHARNKRKSERRSLFGPGRRRRLIRQVSVAPRRLLAKRIPRMGRF